MQTGFSKTPKKFKGNYFNCNKVGHWSKDYQKPKNVKGKSPQVNVVEHDNLSNKVQGINLSMVVFGCNIVINIKKWWVDTGDTHFICSNDWVFSTSKEMDHDEQLYMVISLSSKVEGHRKIVMKTIKWKWDYFEWCSSCAWY